jgi:hypothetical protein
MWYNVIPPFVPLYLSLHLTYPTRTKGLDPSIFRNDIGYVHGYVYPSHELLVVPPIYTPRTIGNQFLTLVYSITNMDKGPIQQ